ncbi:TonB-dependent receptor [Seongchinamella sediminis]|uniref:TonB-dependent receptor n=1 Tax=Seongchinamella sediminis TaxID=2283635 RepID=A0A3L7E1K2_9GAMM|nr:TonB-dependent receptor [Seongchinamella sediminis]RLQ22161.1 TonB-dependent receptor [Seongchinamella sediminis]
MLRKNRLAVAVSAAAGISAFAALPQVVNAQEEMLEEVVVTGSRIQRANLVSASPVTQIDAEEFKFQGVTRVEDLMAKMPQVYSNQNTGQSNGATGTATLNLRNLGAERTLVLVNGRRLPAGSPLQGGIGADINQIPGSLIQRVEVLTGGSSATYGSDAVAGVVNFIMQDDFEGVQLDYQFSQYNHGNDDSSLQRIVRDAGYPVADGSETGGDIQDMSLILGGNFDNGRGNVTMYATYRDVEAISQAERDYSSCAHNADSTGCFGSGTIPDGRVTDFGIGDGFDFKVAGTDFVPRDGTTYNYGPLNYFQRPDERYTAGAFGRYEINEHVETYTELMFMDDRSVSQIAPSGAFFVTDTLACGNPLLSDQQFEQLCGQFGLTEDDIQTAYLGRRNVEGGPRQQDLRHTSFRGVFGLRGDINDTWSYDVYGMYSEVSMENTYQNDLGTTKIRRALDAVEDEDGNIVCRSVVDGSDPNCVPWNIFETGAVTQDQLDYLVLPLFARGGTDQTIYSGYVAGNLGDYGMTIPMADTGIQVAFGAEYREENLDFSPDQGFQLGEGAGQGGATGPVSGGYDVTEFFAEVSLPVIEGAAFAEELIVDLSYRYSDYSTDQTTDTYGIRAGWAITQGIKVRGSFQHAVRAANIQELFLPQGFNLFDMTVDPCGGPNPLRSAADCARSGVTAAQYGSVPNNPAGQYNFLQGGNPDLAPEEADTYTLGVVWTPEFIDGLSLSVDYYSIEIEKGISNLDPSFILDECLDGNDSQCAKVKRGRAGDLWIGSNVETSGNVVALNDNLAVEEVEGWDVIADYSLDIGDMGTLSFSNTLSVITKWDEAELKGAPTTDCKGNWNSSCGYPTPETRNNLRVTWLTPWNVTGSAMWRYISEVEDLDGNIDLDSVNYFDIAGIWDVFDDTASIRLGVNNVLDEAPPVGGSAAGPSIQGNGNVFPGLYDTLGRYWYLGVTVGF